MIRPNEITYLVLDDIDKWLSKYEYEEIELSENKNYIFVKAKKSYDGHLFDVDIEYNDVSRIVYISVYCLTPVSKDKRMLCLKLINFIAPFEKEAKYLLCPNNHIISCLTYHSILNRRCSIGQLIESQASCSIENLSLTYDTIKNDDVKICGIHPVRFYNDFWKGTDYL
jgi:hypothetical protein